LIGSDLVPLLQSAGHQVLRLTGSPRIATDVAWNPDNGVLHSDSLEGMDAVIHLAGESMRQTDRTWPQSGNFGQPWHIRKERN